MPKMSRRTFLWVTGGTGLALASTAHRKLVNKLIPQVIPAENMEPGEWSMIATTCRECPAGCGMHLWHRDGRVTKAEGNPQHPVNRGGLCPRGQSSLQGLYDPDRVTGVIHRTARGMGRKGNWNEALGAIGERIAAGGRVAVVSSLQTGALAEVMSGFAAALGSDRLLFYEPFNYGPLKVAHDEVFGLPVIPSYRIEECNFLISFSSDFLETWISPVSHASQFGEMHAYRGDGRLNRFAYVGPRLSMTAASADDFVQVPPGYERLVALAMLNLILEQGWEKVDMSPVKPAIRSLAVEAGPIPGVPGEKIAKLARSFMAAGESAALAGPMGAAGRMAVETAVAAALLNMAAGNIGRNVDFSAPHALTATASEAGIAAFLSSLGPEDILIIHDTNIVYSRPDVVEHMQRAATTVYLGTLMDETGERAEWFLPIDSPLESWGDYEPSTGIHGLMQPTMNRIYDTRPAGDVFISLARASGRPLSRKGAGAPVPDFRSWLLHRWEEIRAGEAPLMPMEEFWTKALREGGIWSGPKTHGRIALKPTAARLLTSAPPAGGGHVEAGVAELLPWSSIMLFDGRFANRGWIQEAPDPMSFIVWGNWIDMHPNKAAALGIKQGEIAEVSTASGSLRLPVRITDEVTEHAAAVAFGQGHSSMGRNARGIGANLFPLLGPPQQGSMFTPCRIRGTGYRRSWDPTWSAASLNQHGREIVQWIRLSQLRLMGPGRGEELDMPLPEGYKKKKDFYPKREYLSHRWSMVVDMQRCIGCGACGVACYAENNVAIMGKVQVGRQLEMAWLRVVPYRKPGSAMRYSWLPLLCQHCDQAPCEPVCPVFAAVHNEEGLNAQIYNRCIGTRYCNNNCPYKVRRFNWLNTDWRKPLDLQLNPEVTVRCRGVMEKCTFCVQRIRNAEHKAFREGRKVRDGEIQPACVQSCPTRVYTFGDLLDPDSKVSKLIRTDPRRYQVLQELNTKPAVVYLWRIDNDMEA